MGEEKGGKELSENGASKQTTPRTCLPCEVGYENIKEPEIESRFEDL